MRILFSTGDWFLCLITGIIAYSNSSSMNNLCKHAKLLTKLFLFACLRGILQSGVYTLNLWKGPMANTKVEQGIGPSFELNPCAPCISNPDSQSVKVTIQFSRYTYPVFFPSSEPETCSFLLR